MTNSLWLTLAANMLHTQNPPTRGWTLCSAYRYVCKINPIHIGGVLAGARPQFTSARPFFCFSFHHHQQLEGRKAQQREKKVMALLDCRQLLSFSQVIFAGLLRLPMSAGLNRGATGFAHTLVKPLGAVWCSCVTVSWCFGGFHEFR